MGKIDDFEQKLIKQGMKDEDFIEYEKLLKRVRGNFSKKPGVYANQIMQENYIASWLDTSTMNH